MSAVWNEEWSLPDGMVESFISEKFMEEERYEPIGSQKKRTSLFTGYEGMG